MWVTFALALYSAYQQRQAAKESRRAGERQAQIELQTAAEEERKTKIQQELRRAETVARASASGVVLDSESVQSYLKYQDDLNAQELNWIRKSGQNRANIARMQGRLAEMQGNAAATSSAAQAAGYGYKAYQGSGGRGG